jgi:HD-GYP domain-containing protein (c-di-GMP phosphodiesterase class II)
MDLLLVSDSRDRAAAFGADASGSFDIRTIGSSEIARMAPGALVFVDIDLTEARCADELRSWLRRKPRDGIVVFAVDKGSYVQAVRAYSIGATALIPRPVDPEALAARIAREAAGGIAANPLLHCDGIDAGVTALQAIFSSASTGTPINMTLLNQAADILVEHIELHGIGDWVHAVRVHHNPTYQHCLLVCGAAAEFGHRLGFSDKDRRRIAIAGLLHDVGKVKVPIGILEKPGPLDAHEWEEMRRHTAYGLDVLQGTDALHPEMFDVVLHHHEYLDGSGYPDGLRGDDISELARVTTIVDVFSALIERRVYRPAMSGRDAYQVLLDMGPKLDRPLVRAFELLSLAEFE